MYLYMRCPQCASLDFAMHEPRTGDEAVAWANWAPWRPWCMVAWQLSQPLEREGHGLRHRPQAAAARLVRVCESPQYGRGDSFLPALCIDLELRKDRFVGGVPPTFESCTNDPDFGARDGVPNRSAMPGGSAR